jgi:hypothetical protein
VACRRVLGARVAEADDQEVSRGSPTRFASG